MRASTRASTCWCEWASHATLAPDDVDAERGVVLEELRTGLGPEGRFFERLRDLVLTGTPYGGHDVVGTIDSLESMTPEALRRFYEDWYRTDLMSVVAVGDFDPAAVSRQDPGPVRDPPGRARSPPSAGARG